MRRRRRFAGGLSLAVATMLLAPDVDAESCVATREALELELESVEVLDGDEESVRTDEWREEGFAYVGYVDERLFLAPGTVRVEYAFSGGTLRFELEDGE